MTIQFPNERRLRRVLASDGFRLWKVRKNSRHYPEYGLYAVVDGSTKMEMVSGANLLDIQRWIEG